MTIRSKLAVILGFSMLILITLVHFVGHTVLKNRVTGQEQIAIGEDIERVVTFFEDEQDGFKIFTNASSFWADASGILAPARDDRIDSKRIASIFIVNQCDIIAFADAAGQVVQGRAFDRRNGQETLLPTDFQARLLTAKTWQERFPSEDLVGVITFDKTPYIIVIHPTLKQWHLNLGDGVLVLGKRIDGSFIERLSKITNLPLKRRPTMKTGLPEDVKRSLEVGTEKYTTAVQIISKNAIAGLVQVRDPDHQPALVMSFEIPRLLYTQFSRSWTLFTGVFVGAAILIMILSALLIEKMAIARLSKLAAFVKTIDSNADLPSRVPVEGGDEISGLAVSINGMLESLHNFNMERHDLIQRLESDSLEDALTGLYNRRGFLTIGKEYLNLSARNKSRMHLLFLDMDNLKLINDTFGHATGDEAIIRSAEIIKSVFRGSDVKSRLGGDEFAVFPIASSSQGLKSALNRFHEKIAEFNRSGICPFTLSFSAGVAGYDPENPSTIDELLARADKRMYEDKRRKANGSSRG
ncbi:MAG: diguanylate cyclase [Candidatus Aminicenantes bacterium]|nr:diguanylate cyclase [Candidatus Aminicenantes bacterium]